MSRIAGEAKESIVLDGGRLRCPHCEDVGKLLGDFVALQRNPKFAHDLNPVYRHKGCGHVFSPGDPWIIQAYLTGELVPKVALDSLRSTIEELRAIVDAMNTGEGRKAA